MSVKFTHNVYWPKKSILIIFALNGTVEMHAQTSVVLLIDKFIVMSQN